VLKLQYLLGDDGGNSSWVHLKWSYKIIMKCYQLGSVINKS
jgi:hypothetical protein